MPLLGYKSPITKIALTASKKMENNSGMMDYLFVFVQIISFE